jgi:hypothetical protein
VTSPRTRSEETQSGTHITPEHNTRGDRFRRLEAATTPARLAVCDNAEAALSARRK